MSIEIAKAHYIGKPGHKKLNCAQTIVHAFKDKFEMPEEMIESLGSCGGGRAPEGQCGSLYAAKMLLEKKHPDLIRDCEQVLLSSAGSIMCQEIRGFKKLSCVGCVDTIAQYVDKV